VGTPRKRPVDIAVVEAIADVALAMVSSHEKSKGVRATLSVRIPVSTSDALADAITTKYCSIGR
jgi:hypothetical protein